MNLYEYSKLFVNGMTEISEEDLKIGKTLISKYLKERQQEFYMLLCREIYDFTIFQNETPEDSWNYEEFFSAILDCFANRNMTIKQINRAEDTSAIEIWVQKEEQSFCFYLFPYDLGVIKII